MRRGGSPTVREGVRIMPSLTVGLPPRGRREMVEEYWKPWLNQEKLNLLA